MNVQSLIANTTWHPGRHAQSNAQVDISVLLPTFCRAHSGLFERAVQSVLQQQNVNLELIIVDDASVDGTAALIAAFMQQDSRVSCLRHPINIGLPAVSEFEAYQRSRGEFIAFAFDDDEFIGDALEKLLIAARTKKAKFVYGHVDAYFLDLSSKTSVVMQGLGSTISPQIRLRSHNFISNNAVLVHREVLEKVGLYDPHIAMARLCDWDLWCRIAQQYELVPVEIAVGNIHGPMMSDSLGNTYDIEAWFASEWMQLSRNEVLQPSCFPAYDVWEAPVDLSQSSVLMLDAIREKFYRKNWCQSRRDGLDNQRGTIAILVTSLDATVTLHFDRLPLSVRRQCRIIIYQEWEGTLPEELVGASCIIIVRDLFAMMGAVEYARQLKIPHYYFLDDNFFVLANTPEYAHCYHEFQVETVRNELQTFAGMLVSSHALKDYMVLAQLHASIRVLPPIESQAIVCGHANLVRIDDGALKIAFIGGSHRLKSFTTYVVPALIQLSQSQPLVIHLIVDNASSELHAAICLLEAQRTRIKLVSSPITSDLEALLRNLMLSGIQILLHPGEDHINGKYKTLNVLLNAKQMGAVPILSAVEPYLGLARLGVAHVVENTESAWLSALQDCINLPQQSLLKNLNEFCTHEFSGVTNMHTMEQILASHPPVTMVVRDARYRLAMAAQKAVNRQLQAQLRSRRFIVKRALKMLWDAFLTKLKLR